MDTTQEQQIITIRDVVAEIQAEFAATGIDKTERFQHYNGRGINQIWQIGGQVLAKHKTQFLPIANEVVKSDVVMLGKDQNIRPQVHVVVKVDYNVISSKVNTTDLSQRTLEGSSFGEGIDFHDKALNKAMTSAYKNFFWQLFCVPMVGHGIDSEATYYTDKEQSQAAATFAEIPEFQVAEALLTQSYGQEQVNTWRSTPSEYFRGFKEQYIDPLTRGYQ